MELTILEGTSSRKDLYISLHTIEENVKKLVYRSIENWYCLDVGNDGYQKH